MTIERSPEKEMKRQILALAGLAATIAFAIYMVVQLNGQAAPAPTGDFTNAAVAEVKDAQGAVVLQGHFAAADEDDDDVERKAALKPAGARPDAGGEAEVEFAKTSPVTQEIELAAHGLEPGGTYTFAIDGQDLATVTADKRGKAEVEIDVRLTGAAPRP
jgi:hypothetical protein